MTFGEHLEELRGSLVKAIIALAVGLCIGLCFANQVIRFIATPLQAAIAKYQADRDLASLGYTDLDDPATGSMHEFLKEHGVKWQVVYDIPEQFQTLTNDDIAVEEDDEGTANAVVKPKAMKEMLAELPNPNTLKPRLQLIRSEKSLSSFKMEETFLIWIKAGLVVGAVVASPFIFYYIWQFVAAGLYSHERKYVYIYLPVSVILFVSGVVMAFFVVLHYVLNFLLAFNGNMNVSVEPRLTYYVNFVLMLPLGFGVAFQLPLVMLFLQRIGLIETESYINSWKVAVLTIFVISMLLTPADVTSMVLLAIPLVVLYMLGIAMCRFIPRGRGLGSAAYDPA